MEECPSMIIVNTDCHTGQGQHWILMYFPYTTTIEVYDSLCKDVSSYLQDIEHFITKFKTIKFSKGTKQHLVWVLLFIICTLEMSGERHDEQKGQHYVD